MKRLRAVLARLLRVPEGSITPDTAQESVESWNSLNTLLIASELEKAFSVKFTMDDVRAMRSVRDIQAALKRRGASLES